jgi:hypothetical protein
MITIGSLLFGTDEHQGLSRMLGKVGVAAELPRDAAADGVKQLHDQLSAIVHVDAAKLLRDFFTTGYKLRKAAKDEIRPGTANTTQRVDLYSFPIAWRYEAVLQVYVNGVPSVSLTCALQVTFQVSACTVVVTRGFITEVIVGLTTATAHLEIHGVTVRSSRAVTVFAGGPIPLPGRGIPLTHDNAPN